MEVSTENAKVSDSAYSNSYSQSRRSDSSISRRSNRSESSGYCGDRPSTLGSSNEALLQPIGKRKDKERKKKKSKTISTINVESEFTLNNAVPTSEVATCSIVPVPLKTVLKQAEETTDTELVDATDPEEHDSKFVSDPDVGLDSQTNPWDDSSFRTNDGFCAVISMHDGLVVYTTPSLNTALGYPKESWIGRSFIDFVDPKDRATFVEQIPNGIVSPQEVRSEEIDGQKVSLFCGLRKYTPGIRHAFTPKDNKHEMGKAVRYLPFHLILTFRSFQDHGIQQQHRTIFLVVIAQPIYSAYKVPDETIISSNFTIRHTASCHISHVDPDVVQYFGYLPQDMVGRSLFEFYHPEDLPFVKEIYETVIKLKGSSFRSKPYRFSVKNGDYVMLETEWSSFVNPWTRKLEFILDHHRILKGPRQPDVFQTVSEFERKNLTNIREEVLEKSKIIQSEIRGLLEESLLSPLNVTEHEISRQYKNLASFVESLLHEVKKPELMKNLAGNDRSFSGLRNPLLQEHGSVMLDEISPYHEYYDSKSSTETPPSYNQLNYNENIERFFNSKPPITTIYGSDEEKINFNVARNEKMDKLSSPTLAARKCMSPINGSGISGSGSEEDLSSASNNRTSSASRGNTSNTTCNTGRTESFVPPILTESLLNKHNEDMEKLMVHKHKELRSSIKNSDKVKDSRMKSVTEKVIDQSHYVAQGHGIKRRCSHSWEGDNFKIFRHDDISRTSTVDPIPANTTVTSISFDHTSTVINNNSNVNVWPSLSVTAPSSGQPCVTTHNAYPQAILRYPTFPQMIPVYYFPVPRNKEGPSTTSQEHPDPLMTSTQSTTQNPYIPCMAMGMAGVMYPPIIGASASTAMMYRPFLTLESGTVAEKTSYNVADKFSERKQTTSQTTSIKAKPGNTMDMSKPSKKVLLPDEMFSSCVSINDGCSSGINQPQSINVRHNTQTDYNVDGSSSSSFYSSFLNKSSDSSCNPDQRESRTSLEKMTWEKNEVKQQNANQQRQSGMLRKEPSWLEGVKLTPELIYKYQVNTKTLSEALQADMKTLKKINQPLLVNDQLGQLYLDLELEGFESKLMLEDGMTSSGSDSGSSVENGISPWSEYKQKKRMVKYGKLVMIHEENAPFPPPQETLL